MKPLSERIKTFSTSQFVDWLCLACVDVREVHTPYDAQEEINKIREALTERLSTMQEQLTATTNSLTNAQEALKSAGIEADTVQAGVMELVSRMSQMVAENASLKKSLITIANSERFDGDSFVCDFDSLVSVAAGALSTPATNAYLNAVRAEGVEMFANHFNCPDISDDILEFAAQLRAGNAGKDGSHE